MHLLSIMSTCQQWAVVPATHECYRFCSNYIPATAQTPPLVAIGFELLNPVSEGSVTIQSDNSFQIAAADDGFYQNPVDLENMKSAVSVYIRALLDQLVSCIHFPRLTLNPF